MIPRYGTLAQVLCVHDWPTYIYLGYVCCSGCGLELYPWL